MKAGSLAVVLVGACAGGLCVGAGAFLAGQRSASVAAESSKAVQGAEQPDRSRERRAEAVRPVAAATWTNRETDRPLGAQEPAPSDGADDQPAAGKVEKPAERRAATKFTELQASIQVEARDVGWGREVEDRVRELVGQELSGGKFSGEVVVRKVECGSVRCAVEASATNDRDAENLGRTLTRGLRLRRGRVYHQQQDGARQVQVIAAREGYDIFGGERPLPP